jgi:hypothetical protein
MRRALDCLKILMAKEKDRCVVQDARSAGQVPIFQVPVIQDLARDNCETSDQ